MFICFPGNILREVKDQNCKQILFLQTPFRLRQPIFNALNTRLPYFYFANEKPSLGRISLAADFTEYSNEYFPYSSFYSLQSVVQITQKEQVVKLSCDVKMTEIFRS